MASSRCIAWHVVWVCALPVACASAPTPVLRQPVGFTHTEPAAGPATPPRRRPAKGHANAPTHPAEQEHQPLYMVCALPNTPLSALYFADDGFALGRREKRILKQVARCLCHGTLKGDRVVVFGYADPAGRLALQRERRLPRCTLCERHWARELAARPTCGNPRGPGPCDGLVLKLLRADSDGPA
jgi:hypothetical protein